MASKATKEKILATALQLFNKNGFVNVRMQHICDASLISLGNINYHFRTKDDILYTICKKVEEEQKNLMAEFKTLPLFEDFDRYILAQYNLLSENLFFYTDTLEIIRAYPEIAIAHRQHTIWQETQLAYMMQFNVARGSLLKCDTGVYEQLSAILLWLSENWHNRQAVLNKEITNFTLYQNSLWALLMPYMTVQGKKEYQQIKQLKELGEYGSQFFY